MLLVSNCYAAAAAAPPVSIKTVDKCAPPTEVHESIRKLLSDTCVQLLDDKGEVLTEVWFSKTLLAKATDNQIKNGLTYRELPETVIVGAIRIVKQTTDYRKQKLEPGVYTLRVAFQPMTGDHMGTAPHTEFCLMSSPEDDAKPDLMEGKTLQEMSKKINTAHPSVLLLFPGGTDSTEKPKLVNKGDGQWIIQFKQNVTVGDKKATINLGLTLIGVSAQA